jgi:hypothetical protein
MDQQLNKSSVGSELTKHQGALCKTPDLLNGKYAYGMISEQDVTKMRNNDELKEFVKAVTL